MRRTIISVDTRLAEWRGKGWYSVVRPQTLARRGWDGGRGRTGTLALVSSGPAVCQARIVEKGMLLIEIHG